MVNRVFNLGSLVGLALILASIAIFLLPLIFRRQPRDMSFAYEGRHETDFFHDLAFSLIYFVSGGILFTNSWRLDILLQIVPLLLGGASVYLFLKDAQRRFKQ